MEHKGSNGTAKVNGNGIAGLVKATAEGAPVPMSAPAPTVDAPTSEAGRLAVRADADRTVATVAATRPILSADDISREHIRAIRATLKTAYREAAIRVGMIERK